MQGDSRKIELCEFSSVLRAKEVTVHPCWIPFSRSDVVWVFPRLLPCPPDLPSFPSVVRLPFSPV